MIARCLQLFSIAFLACLVPRLQAEELKTGSTHAFHFTDVDDNEIATDGGRVTIITVVTRSNEEKAHAVADLVPDKYLGDPKFIYVTLVNFQGKLPGLVHAVTRGVIRGRLDAEAKELKPQYAAKNLTRDPRQDVHVIADFDGAAVEELGLPVNSEEVAVFVFSGKGKLVQRWNGVPPDDSLGKAIAQAAE
ncbi:MAG: hypothetical protein ACR2HH_11915 [Chthoniobacterales bacterium]